MTDVPPEWGRHIKAREIAAECYRVGWIDADKLLIAVSICIAESNGYEKRRNYNPPVLDENGKVIRVESWDRGAWALNSVAFPNVTDSAADNFVIATGIARSIYANSGGHWTPWSSYANGQYKGPRAMGYALDGVRNFLAEKHGFPVPA